MLQLMERATVPSPDDTSAVPSLDDLTPEPSEVIYVRWHGRTGTWSASWAQGDVAGHYVGKRGQSAAVCLYLAKASAKGIKEWAS